MHKVLLPATEGLVTQFAGPGPLLGVLLFVEGKLLFTLEELATQGAHRLSVCVFGVMVIERDRLDEPLVAELALVPGFLKFHPVHLGQVSYQFLPAGDELVAVLTVVPLVAFDMFLEVPAKLEGLATFLAVFHYRFLRVGVLLVPRFIRRGGRRRTVFVASVFHHGAHFWCLLSISKRYNVSDGKKQSPHFRRVTSAFPSVPVGNLESNETHVVYI